MASFERLLQHFKLADAPDSLVALEQIETWLRFDLGTGVYLQARGVGRVSEINLSLGTVRVDFGAGTRLSLRLAEAQKLLRVLEPGHFLLDKLENPEALQQLAANSPGQVLERIFTSLGSPLPMAELREALAGLVAEENWATWWKSARTDPRLAVGSGARPLLTWSATAEAADAGLLAQFEAASPRERLDMARKHAARSPELGAVLARGVAEAARAARKSDPSLALEARLGLEKMRHGAGADTGFEAAELLQVGDAVPVVAGVQDRSLREAALQILREVRSDWAELYARLLRAETDSRTLAMLYDVLRSSRSEILEPVLDDVLARPGTAPRLFVWLCREPERLGLERRDAWALLRRLLDVQSEEAFRGLRTPLREVFDHGALAEQLVARLTAEQAEQLLLALGREIGVEEHRKESLRGRVFARFPELRDMGEEVLYSTSEALDRKKAEFERIVKVEIPHNAEEIRKAAAHGDLRENFEYKAARDKHEMLSSHAKRLHDDLRRARALDPAGIDAGAVRVGTRITLEPVGDGAQRRTLVLLGPWDSDPAAGIVSYLAPAVQPLLGKRPGETVRFGEADFIVSSIEVWRPA